MKKLVLYQNNLSVIEVCRKILMLCRCPSCCQKQAIVELVRVLWRLQNLWPQKPTGKSCRTGAASAWRQQQVSQMWGTPFKPISYPLPYPQPLLFNFFLLTWWYLGTVAVRSTASLSLLPGSDAVSKNLCDFDMIVCWGSFKTQNFKWKTSAIIEAQHVIWLSFNSCIWLKGNKSIPKDKKSGTESSR